MRYFKLFEIIFLPVGIYGAVICIPPDMYHIADVTEAEKSGGNVGHDVTTIPYHVKALKPFANPAPQTAVYNARTTETEAENIVCNVGTVEYAIFMAK